jgi:cobalt/nickel transport system permease protein
MAVVWAVHILDGILSWPWLAGGFVLSGVLCWLGLRNLDEQGIARLGVLSAALFVATLIHVPTPAGTSVHLLFNGLAGVLLGRRAGVAILLALVLQALLLGHGGVTTIGVNTAIMGLPALAAWGLFVRLRHAGWMERGWSRWSSGLLLGSGTVLATASLDALTLWLGSGEPLAALAVLVLLAHVPVAGAEGLVLAAAFDFLHRVKPEMLGFSLPGTAPPVCQQRERQAG